MSDGKTDRYWNRWITAALATVMCVACILWNIEFPTRIGIAILSQQYMAFQLGLVLTLAFLRFDTSGQVKSQVGVIDGSIAIIVFLTLMYTAWDFSWRFKACQRAHLRFF